jgi:hypothetical protein
MVGTSTWYSCSVGTGPMYIMEFVGNKYIVLLEYNTLQPVSVQCTCTTVLR